MERIPLADIRKSFEHHLQEYPPLLSVDQAARLAHMARGTLLRKISEGAFKRSVKRGKPVLFFRDFFVQELMSSDRSGPYRYCK